MDFEISDDGTLIHYSGSGGDVVIPEGVKFIERYSIFDNDNEITSLTLPKSFIGRKFKICYKNGFIYNAQDNSVSNCFVNKRIKEQEATHENLYSYLYLPWLRHLERYIVHPQNPVYESVDGVLFSKCRRFVIDVPFMYHPRALTLFGGFEKVLKADNEVKEVESVRYMGSSLSTEQLDEIARLCGIEMHLFAPKITHCELCKLNGRWDKSKKRIIAIMPELRVTEKLVDNLGFGLVIGYCHNRHIYNEELSKQYIEMLLKNEVELYDWGVQNASAAVKNFYKKEWDKKRLPKIDISNSSGLRQYLFEVILRGSVQDLQELLDKDSKVLHDRFKTTEESIRVLDYAIALTIRYGGVDKLRVLLEAADKEYCSCKSLPLHLYDYGYDLWVTGERIFNHDPNYSALEIASSHEVRHMAPLNEYERLKCLMLLSKRGILNIKCDRASNLLCALALLCGDFKIAKYMLSHGANLQTFISENKEYLVKIEFYHWIHHATLHCLLGVVRFIELSSTEEMRFSMQLKDIKLLMHNGPDEFAKIFNLVDVQAKYVVELFKEALSRSYPQAVHAIATSNQIRSNTTLRKLLDLATKYNAHEATAILLDRNQEFQSKAETTKTSIRSSLRL
ncbi:MAG: hypothetical protein SOV16_04125 [Anaerobiospirillum succiniciproducens]|uniref:hypothetical protein n=1 Tax=Anaerobiospirillum succiniciproducens TaxID=13335 RepID=UPI002A75790D|nr:hypothetical protein [Anaerobiospirillum succiniciproducens]MDY2798348.1 hypothetical protein [Anaerobiospirillum succiniciproducens]